MLLCLRWLPVPCLLMFGVCFVMGWLLWIPHPKMTLIFYAYDQNGKHVTAKAIDTKGTIISKLTRPVGELQTVRIVPEASGRYQAYSQEVTWRSRADFLRWLDSDFQDELKRRHANLPAWQSTITQLKADAVDTSCNYPFLTPSQ